MMAEMMYDTLHGKLLKLPDEVEVYPAHGAGSMCGRNMSKETSSTIGEQRKFNYALKPMSKEEFVKLMTATCRISRLFSERRGDQSCGRARDCRSLSTRCFVAHEVFSCRRAARVARRAFRGEFRRGHVPGSVNIGLGGSLRSGPAA
jgi:hypothetical protein